MNCIMGLVKKANGNFRKFAPEVLVEWPVKRPKSADNFAPNGGYCLFRFFRDNRVVTKLLHHEARERHFLTCLQPFWLIVTLLELKENPAYIYVDQRPLSPYAPPYELAGEM